MAQSADKSVMRARDFWGALGLMALSIFFLWRTSQIPLFGGNRAGVSGADWYNSAAIVPLGIFAGLFVLSCVLLTISIRAGGAAGALSAVGIGWNRREGLRIATLALILFFYIAGLVPRVDFIISGGLLITCLILGYHRGLTGRMLIATAAMGVAGAYALMMHPDRAGWRAHDDDVLALVLWIGLTFWALARARGDRIMRVIPLIAVIAPLVLVTAMAFGFRQNVPNRGGLIFAQIEYHYYVTLRPLWRD